MLIYIGSCVSVITLGNLHFVFLSTFLQEMRQMIFTIIAGCIIWNFSNLCQFPAIKFNFSDQSAVDSFELEIVIDGHYRARV